MDSFEWTGTHISGAKPCATVRYVGSTDHKPSRWIATLKRGKDDIYRAVVAFDKGPLEAAKAACLKASVPHWQPYAVASLDGAGDNYAVLFFAP